MSAKKPPQRPSNLEANDDTHTHDSATPDHFSDLNVSDAEKQEDVEKLDHGHHDGCSQKTSHSTSPCRSPPVSDNKIVVSFEQNDPADPYNWSRTKKLYCVVTCVFMVMNSTIGSSLPTGASRETQQFFHLDNQELLVLPNSIYLIGYVLGPIVFAPLSESYGRKTVMISTFIVFTAFTLGCALAPTFAGLIIMRLFVGIGASTPVSVVGGIYADIYENPRARGKAVASFMAATTWGPLVGPIISGFVSPVSWRWSYWVALIVAGVTWPFLLMVPETFGPVLLRRKAARMRKETGNANIIAPADLEEHGLREKLLVILTRPIRMFLFEAIVLFTCLYLALAYGIFYVFFQAYPIVFGGIYGFNAGETGLAFLPVGVGALFAAGIYLWWDYYLFKVKSRPSPPAWSQKEEFIRLPLACIGGPLFVISLFWLGWTARADIHWAVPVLAALPFGVGFLLIFMSLTNYIVDAYEVFAASAMAATAASRSIVGVVLPFAAKPLYENLGVAWACSLLGFLSAAMTIVPFIFIKYGAKIRANSNFCQELKRKKGEEAEKKRGREEGRAFGVPADAAERV